MNPAPRPPRRITLVFRNRQRSRPVPTAALRRLARHVLTHSLQLHGCALGVHFVADPEITRLNESFLHHAGPTDVITFNHGPTPEAPDLHGEIFICVPEALRQARRFRTRWTHEIARYLIHGLLHLRGYEDCTPTDRRAMKRAEDRLLRAVRHHLDPQPPADP